MVIHYPPARLRANSDQPTAITNVLLATSGSSARTGDLPLGSPTCSARSRRGRWALYPNGEQVIVVWPAGALAGPPGEVAGELDRLGDGQDDLDRAAVWAIRQFLTDPATQDGARWSSTRTRTWSSPAAGYWLSGPTNQSQYGDPPASWSGAAAPAPPIPLPDPSPQPGTGTSGLTASNRPATLPTSGSRRNRERNRRHGISQQHPHHRSSRPTAGAAGAAAAAGPHDGRHGSPGRWMVATLAGSGCRAPRPHRRPGVLCWADHPGFGQPGRLGHRSLPRGRGRSPRPRGLVPPYGRPTIGVTRASQGRLALLVVPPEAPAAAAGIAMAMAADATNNARPADILAAARIDAQDSTRQAPAAAPAGTLSAG